MQKVFETYAGRKGVNPSFYRFLLDGERIQPTDTPNMLEMEDQDQINCVLTQSGGRGS
jgi:small ubiquitin-related modifier